MKKYLLFLTAAVAVLFSCKKETEKKSYKSYDEYPATDENLWTEYSPEKTVFKLWSPAADGVSVKLYDKGDGGAATDSVQMMLGEKGVWHAEVKKDLKGKYYTFQVKLKGKLLPETPGMYAQAVGVNGQRAMVIDLKTTNPEGWDADKVSNIKPPNQAVIYELHVRDLSTHTSAGIKNVGKFLGLIEPGTK